MAGAKVKYDKREAIGEWGRQAACKSPVAPTMFPKDVEGVNRAIRFCRDYCPVIAECGQHALTNDERWGCWGGMGEDERERIMRKMKRA